MPLGRARRKDTLGQVSKCQGERENGTFQVRQLQPGCMGRNSQHPVETGMSKAPWRISPWGFARSPAWPKCCGFSVQRDPSPCPGLWAPLWTPSHPSSPSILVPMLDKGDCAHSADWKSEAAAQSVCIPPGSSVGHAVSQAFPPGARCPVSLVRGRRRTAREGNEMQPCLGPCEGAAAEMPALWWGGGAV